MTYWAKFLAAFALASSHVYGSNLDMVMLPDPSQATTTTLLELGGLTAGLLNSGADGRKVALVRTPVDWSFAFPAQRDYTLEVFVTAGELRWQDQTLRRHDYAYLPAGASAAALATGQSTELLLYFDPPRGTDGNEARVVHTETIAWRGGSVAQRDTGRALKLEVKDLRKVDATGQRTWLLRAGADLDVPWERHNTVEEGYLLSGQYRLVECLPQGQVASDYQPGGYFYRPPGIVHSGPESGARTEVLWLLRSPTRLDVEFLPHCEEDRG